MGKVAVTLSRLLERILAEGVTDWNVFVSLEQPFGAGLTLRAKRCKRRRQ